MRESGATAQRKSTRRRVRAQKDAVAAGARTGAAGASAGRGGGRREEEGRERVHGRKRGGQEGAQHESAQKTRRKARGKRAAIAGDAPEGLRDGAESAQNVRVPIFWTFAITQSPCPSHKTLNLGIFTIFDKNSGVLEFFPQEPWSFQDPGVVCEMPPRSWSLPLYLGVLTQKPKKKSRRHHFFSVAKLRSAQRAPQSKGRTLLTISPLP